MSVVGYNILVFLFLFAALHILVQGMQEESFLFFSHYQSCAADQEPCKPAHNNHIHVASSRSICICVQIRCVHVFT